MNDKFESVDRTRLVWVKMFRMTLLLCLIFFLWKEIASFRRIYQGSEVNSSVCTIILHPLIFFFLLFLFSQTLFFFLPYLSPILSILFFVPVQTAKVDIQNFSRWINDARFVYFSIRANFSICLCNSYMICLYTYFFIYWYSKTKYISYIIM